MQKNMGSVDRGIRGLVGVLLLCIFLFAPPATPLLYWGSMIVGLGLIATAVFAWCPPYTLFGINTCDTKGDAKEG